MEMNEFDQALENEITLRAEYAYCQLAMRALDVQIQALQLERHAYASQCHEVVSRAVEQGVKL